MNRKYTFIVFTLLAAGITTLGLFLARGHAMPVMQPQGVVGAEQKNLIILATYLMLIVVIPVFVLTAAIVLKYRADNKKARYSPDWDGNRTLEAIWWGVPGLIILILAAITWTSSHKLDPFRPLDTAAKPMTIQVVALQWKWLFIYPEEHIATLNFVQFPKDRPVDFQITSDAPMNSFWIPQLGGQVYAMSGMSTHLHLMANQTGTYQGVSANLSGNGFAGMKFTAKTTSQEDYDQWVKTVQHSPYILSNEGYAALAKPTENAPVMYYASPSPALYDNIVGKYMPNMDMNMDMP